MKKTLSILLLLVSLSITAQQNNKERLKALKVSIITEKLDLSEKEAQELWPIYNAFEKKMYEIRHNQIRAIRKEIKDSIDNLTDKKAKELLKKLNDTEIETHKARITYANSLLTILSPKKIILLKIAEEDFKKKMLEEYRKRRKGEH